ncbi:hypothetical protein LY78DRAFT_267067 [Colletotrichum sublineola]|nr:hypothetical protein LY78DRAFT_267067 [Colletotrichum sublineola]
MTRGEIRARCSLPFRAHLLSLSLFAILADFCVNQGKDGRGNAGDGVFISARIHRAGCGFVVCYAVCYLPFSTATPPGHYSM